MGIPEPAAEITPQAQIPQGVAGLPPESEAPEIEPYVISFAKYNQKMCEIHLLESNKAKKALETLKQIGIKITCQADFQKNSIDRIPIKNEGTINGSIAKYRPMLILKKSSYRQRQEFFILILSQIENYTL